MRQPRFLSAPTFARYLSGRSCAVSQDVRTPSLRTFIHHLSERSHIITRSGGLLRFTDSEDEKTFKIELKYNETNGIVLTVKEDEGTMTIQTTKDIYVKAPELIQFESKKIAMLAEETIQASAKDRIDVVAEKTVHIESPEKLELMANDMTEAAENEFSMAGKNVKMKADSSMVIDGDSKYEVKVTSIKSNQ